jgi:hypothetical protein
VPPPPDGHAERANPQRTERRNTPMNMSKITTLALIGVAVDTAGNVYVADGNGVLELPVQPNRANRCRRHLTCCDDSPVNAAVA